MKEAFYLAGTGRPGPVLIDVPLDVQKKELDFAYPDSVSIRGYHPSTRANPLQLRRVAEAIAAARRRSSAQGAAYSAPGPAHRCKALPSAAVSR